MSDKFIIRRTLQEQLQAEFCPPLDTSLLAALLSELDMDSEIVHEEQLASLRETLLELSSQAEQDEVILAETVADLQVSNFSATTDDTCSSGVHDFYGETTSSSVSSTSSCDQPFSSPLGFLQAAFPHFSSAKLKNALKNTKDQDDIDMESIVEALLTDEYVRELEERGLDGLDPNGDEAGNGLAWKTVGVPKSKRNVGLGISHVDVPGKRKKSRGKTISLVDIRQQHHVRPLQSRTNSEGSWDGSHTRAAPDPWTQLSSLSTHLATLVPTHSASYFQSIFHSPEYPSPSAALRVALRSSSPGSSSATEDELPADHMKLLFGILDILCSSPTYLHLDAEQRTQLASDAELALRATNGMSDATLDLVWLLRDLDNDSISTDLEMGVYHSPPPAPVTIPISYGPSPFVPNDSSTIRVRLPSAPPPIPAPPELKPQSKLPSAQSRSVFQWQTVPHRKPTSKGPHSHASFIPAYNPAPGQRKARNGGNTLGKGGKGDVGELFGKRMMGEWRIRRDEALRQATRHWQKGNSKTRGGEVALYFAERAREFQERSRQEALDAAREVISRKRETERGNDTVDLHGLTVSEALIIVNDVLQEQMGGPSASRPVKIITGRGHHSVNRVGVLGPAIKNALEEDGWIVGKWDGGLIVRGKVPGRA